MSVNSNWVHPPDSPRENCFNERSSATRTIFGLIPCPGAKNDGRIPAGVGQNFHKLEETALLACKKSLKN